MIDELRELDLEVDFNQGLDARLVTDEVAKSLRDLRSRQFAWPMISPAWVDSSSRQSTDSVQRA